MILTVSYQHTFSNFQRRNIKVKARRGELNTLAVVVAVAAVAGVVGVSAWCAKDIPIVKNIIGKFFGWNNTRAEQTISLDREEESPHLKQAREILRALDEKFGDFMKAGAIEDFECTDSENESWRGQNVFMLSGGRAGFIDGEKFAANFVKALQPDTLEINEEGTLFQADMSDTSSFSVNAIIDSSTVRADSLRPLNANYVRAKDLPGRIADTVKNFSGSQESYGYIRFIFKTDNNSAKIMAAFSLDPYAFSQHKTFLILGKNYVFTTSQRLREIEESINIMSDINAVSFTMKRGHVESYNDLAECLRKFVQSFAE